MRHNEIFKPRFRFSENYQSSFHFEKNKNRGHSTIFNVQNSHHKTLVWMRGEEADIVRVKLGETLQPEEEFILKIEYQIVLPDDKFTRYGITNSGDFNIRYW